MSYTYTYPRPAVTVDCLIFTQVHGTWQLLLIQRDKPPFEGAWALPGGFVDIDEPLQKAAERELEEETGVRQTDLKQFHTFGQPGRDPRGRTISVVYYGFADTHGQNPNAGSDARNAKWFDLNNLPDLAFDHHQIIDMARKQIDL
ncbi:MAG: NUDIX hydrolase [Bacteroidales bacterium]|nr:NUDIX hydrolase [Bacteroidales bacterium]